MAAKGQARTVKKTEVTLYKTPGLFGRWQKNKNLFGRAGVFLAFLGQPIFYLILFVVYSLLLVTSTGTKLALWLFKKITTLPRILRYLKLPKIKLSLPKIKVGKLKISPLKIKIPRLYFPKPQISKKPTAPVIFLFLALSFGLFSYFYIFKDLPDPSQLITQDQIVTTKILDRNGKLLYKIYHNQNRSLVKLKDIPLSLKQATIAIEDSEFYRHPGFSWRGILRSVWIDLSHGKMNGGSTITQQLVKNALLTPQKTWQRKIKELILAIWVETRFSKDQILEMYLNNVGYGGATYGVQEASQLYFGKDVKDLTSAEAALLAGLPASPTTYSPFGSHPQLAKLRQEQVLHRMDEEKYINSKQAQQAMMEELHYTPQKTDIEAPHFVMYVKDLLIKKYGSRLVEEGGLEVRTSLDLSIQSMAQKAVTDEVNKLGQMHVSNGAALVTNPKTGEILAMVGSKDYFDLKNQGNYNVTTALRQPGSSIKPVNYSVALSMGFTPATIIPDTPITYQLPGQEPYSPRNYDDRFHGNVPLRIALASSYNVPAVKVLSAVGVSRMVEQGKKMGITTWDDSSRFGLSLTLGAGEVKMVDMAVVYGTLANVGMKVNLHPILEIKDYRGKILEKDGCISPTGNEADLAADSSFCEGAPVLNPLIAYQLTNILSDNQARTPAFGPNSALVIPDKTVAVKTGTSNSLKDNWAIGYTPSLLAVIWVGNNDASPMARVASGVTGASPIWHNIMAELLKDKPDEKFKMPENLVKIKICSFTGTLPCEGCPTKEELFIPGTEPKFHCKSEQLTPTPTPTP